MRLGKLLKSLLTLGNAISATTGSLRRDGVAIPAGLERLEKNAVILAQAGILLDEQGGALREFDGFFDRAAMVDATIKLVMLDAEGAEMESMEMSPFLVDAMDALLDKLNPD